MLNNSVSSWAFGLVPETSLPNRWPHNTILELDIREEKECCRSIHLQSGLPYTFSYPFACLTMSFDRPAPFSPGKIQWEALTKEKFQGKRCCFGQLVWYEKPNLWAATPCTSGSAWQRLNKAKLGSQFKNNLKQTVRESRELFSRFRRHGETVLHQGGVSFEWPRDCDSWARGDVAAFFREYAQVFTPATFHGCALGLKDSNGCPIKKP